MAYKFTCKQCRRFGLSVCGRENCAFKRKPFRPGVHGKGRSRTSEYGRQLMEKQKLKLLYGVRERQFRNYFSTASQMRELTGPTLLSLLERRLDNVVYRLGLAPNRRAARQLVSHGHITLNGRKVTIPSIIVRLGDQINIRAQSKERKVFENLTERLEKYEPPVWLSLNKEERSGPVLAEPDQDSLTSVPVEVAQVVEFYSR